MTAGGSLHLRANPKVNFDLEICSPTSQAEACGYKKIEGLFGSPFSFA